MKKENLKRHEKLIQNETKYNEIKWKTNMRKLRFKDRENEAIIVFWDVWAVG